MCGFISTHKKGIGTNRYIRMRGEDLTQKLEVGDYVFIHNLLHITGEVNPQPFVDGEIVCVYNGEIYNLPYSKSDGENIIPLYKEYGSEFPKHLDGEFAISLWDFKKGKAVFCTDSFRTKPIWINEDGVASYKSGLFRPSRPIPPNTIVSRDLVSGLDTYGTLHRFDFSNQHKDSYEDWFNAFEKAVMTRGKDLCFIGLSSGYDSGGIECVLKKFGVNHFAFSIRGDENEDILSQRNSIMSFTAKDAEEVKRYLENMEDFEYSYYSQRGSAKGDPATYGMGFIFSQAKKLGCKVYLSGQGADEILSDYGKWASQSDLRGHFPKDLKPWTNFFGGCQQAYLGKEEHTAGAYSIEGRYPYLDNSLVQEFLWLSQDLKNKEYKAPLSAYLEKEGYPFRKDEKIGFMALSGVA